jgi:hypothetical protein
MIIKNYTPNKITSSIDDSHMIAKSNFKAFIEGAA